MEKKITFAVLVLCILSFPVLYLVFLPEQILAIDSASVSKEPSQEIHWKYQCIDTMKTSRDKARAWASRSDLSEYVDTEILTISRMGANCVALDTPYDPEFLPYLKVWVESARKKQLKIWFRGNFSGWEGWFDYPRGMSEEQLFDNTKKFISSNSDLFLDGDIFTAAPEGENGGPFNQVEIDEYPRFRKFLIEENRITKEAFKNINRNVETHWLSMNGGLARRMLDQDTISKINNTATLDHYIKTAAEMGDYINYFKNTFNAKTIIGEFGAPIPEITGNMSEDQQASFVEQLFSELYLHRSSIEGLNYWILTDGSTELVSSDFKPRKVVSVIEKYFKPSSLSGSVVDTLGDPIMGVKITIAGIPGEIKTNEQGEFTVLLPAQTAIVNFEKDGYIIRERKIDVGQQQKVTIKTVLDPVRKDLLYLFEGKYKSIQKSLSR